MTMEADVLRHAPRPVRLIDREVLAGWRVKVYGISLAGEAVRDELIALGKETAAATLPASVENRDLGRYAFVVIHDAPDNAYVLVHWWAGGNEMHQKVFSAPRESLDAMTTHPTDAIGCVWELSVVEFERQAWLDCVVRNGDNAAPADYFQRTFRADV